MLRQLLFIGLVYLTLNKGKFLVIKRSNISSVSALIKDLESNGQVKIPTIKTIGQILRCVKSVISITGTMQGKMRFTCYL